MAAGRTLWDLYTTGRAGEENLAMLMDVLAQQPMLGVNVHAPPRELRPAWIAEQAIEPVAFGAFEDPVSQLAMLGAPGALRSLKGLLETAASPGPRYGALLAGERGNLGPVPRSQTGAPLPESTVRTPEGQLQRLYHGTGRAYPDFDVSQYGSGAGGDLYGPGIYMTASPDVAGGYAKAGSNLTRETVVPEGNWNEVYEALKRHGLDRQINKDIHMVKTGVRDPASGRELYTAYRLHEHGANIRPVYADLKRPFDVSKRMKDEEIKDLLYASPRGSLANVTQTLDNYSKGKLGVNRSVDMTGQQLYDVLTTWHGGDKTAVNKLLQQQGYDGITHMGGAVTGGQPHRVYIAFTPENVYPAFNVEGVAP